MWSRMAAVFLFCVGLCATMNAQVRLSPQPYPSVTAINMSWYASGEALPIFGDYYYPTGPTVFFNGNQMVPTVVFGGVQLYADATLEPFSIVFVPIGGGLMRPYERRRAGPLAGTVGSTTPSFPVAPSTDLTPSTSPLISASAALPTTPAPAPARAVGDSRAMVQMVPQPVGTAGTTAIAPMTGLAPRTRAVTIARPTGVNGIWIDFAGARWQAAGKAEGFSEGAFVRYGDYEAHPVYVRRGTDLSRTPSVIFVPGAAGRVMPFARVR